jgi:hypothetical protein
MDSQTDTFNESSALNEDSYDDARIALLNENSTCTLRGKSVEDYLNEDTSFGGNMLKLHRSLSEANSKIVVMAQPGRPNPFKPTVIQTNDVLAMSSTGVSFPKLAKQHTSIGRAGGEKRGRQTIFSRTASSLTSPSSTSTSTLATSTRERDAPVAAGTLILNQQEMASFNKKLDKLGEVDSIVESVRTELMPFLSDYGNDINPLYYYYSQALRHRDRIEEYTRLNTMFHSLAGQDRKIGPKASSRVGKGGSLPTSELQFIAGNFNMEGYDPKRAL